MSNKLYEITNNFLEVMEAANNGEIGEEKYEEVAKELALELEQKSGSIIGYIKNVENYINGLDSEIKRLKENKDVAQNKINRFKEYVIREMKKLDITSVETPIGVLSLRKSPLSVEVIDEEKIPNEYKTIKQTYSIDKTKLKNDFKETGELIDGVQFIDNKVSLNIK